MTLLLKRSYLENVHLKRYVSQLSSLFARLHFTHNGTLSIYACKILDVPESVLTTTSYQNMFLNLLKKLTHCVDYTKNDDNHLDRKLNVIGSGYHSKFYIDQLTDEIVVRCGSKNPPKYIVECGCGDGTLLLNIKSKIPSSIHIVATDLSEIALSITVNKLTEQFPNDTFTSFIADITDPQGIVDELSNNDILMEDCLFIRSFIDHERVYTKPTASTKYITDEKETLVYCNGDRISDNNVYGSLIEYLLNWKKATHGSHGILMTEVFSQHFELHSQHLSDMGCHFDLYHELSEQILVPPSTFIDACVHVGLIPDKVTTYPDSYTRIMLMSLKSGSYSIQRLDINRYKDYLRLDSDVAMQWSYDTFQKTCSEFPIFQYCLVENDVPTAIVFSKETNRLNIENKKKMMSCSYDTIQLLRLVSNSSIGVKLIHHLQQKADINKYKHVVGVTNCSSYDPTIHKSYELYVESNEDPNIKFHTQNGAIVEKICYGYYPDSLRNLGNGVLIYYPTEQQNPCVEFENDDNGHENIYDITMKFGITSGMDDLTEVLSSLEITELLFCARDKGMTLTFDDIFNCKTVDNLHRIMVNGNTSTSKRIIDPKRMKTVVSKNTITKILDTKGCAYHSSLIDPYINTFTQLLKMVKFKVPSDLHAPIWHYANNHIPSDLEFWVHGFRQPVQFDTIVKRLPTNASVLEIGPHPICRPYLNFSDHDCFIRRNKTNSVVNTMQSLWLKGVNMVPLIETLRPALNERDVIVEMNPNSIPLMKEQYYSDGIIISFDFLVNDTYILDHIIDSVVIFPGVAYMYSIWEAISKKHNIDMNRMTLFYNNFMIHKPIVVNSITKVDLVVNLLRTDSNKLDLYSVSVTYNGDLTVTCNVEFSVSSHTPPDSGIYLDNVNDTISGIKLYQNLSNFGYQYGKKFCPITDANLITNQTILECPTEGSHRSRWIPTMDGLLQGCLLLHNRSFDEMYLPKFISSICIWGQVLPPTVVANCSKYSCVSSIAKVDKLQMNVKAVKRVSMYNDALNTEQVIKIGSYQQHNDLQCLLYQNILHHVNITMLKPYLDSLGDAILPHQAVVRDMISNSEEYDTETCAVCDNDVYEMASQPDAIWLRLLLHLYDPSNIENFVKNPIECIVRYNEHKDLYHKDISMIRPSTINMFFEIVRENTNTNAVSVCEIGAGTGGMTKWLANNPFVSPYIATDITTHFRKECDENVGSDIVEHKIWNIDTEYGGEKVDLIVGSNAFHTCTNIKNTLNYVSNALVDQGYLMIIEGVGPLACFTWGLDEQCWKFDRSDGREFGLWTHIDAWKKILESSNFVHIYTELFGDQAIMLWRKSSTIAHDIITIPTKNGHLDNKALEMIKYNITKQCTEQSLCKWFITDDIGCIGLFRTLFTEHCNVRVIICSDISTVSTDTINKLIDRDLIINIIDECGTNIAYYQKEHQQMLNSNNRFEMTFPNTGNIALQKWCSKSTTKEEIRIKYVCLNFKDVMISLNRINKSHVTTRHIGFEFMGEYKNKPIAGFSLDSTISNYIDKNNAEYFIHCPTSWTHEELATVPSVYYTAYYCLDMCARIRPGSSVLIHSGTGGVGLACLNILKNRNVTIFTTCGSEKKKNFILKNYPMINESHIGCSRDKTFMDMVMKYTEFRGVDVVINSLSGDLLRCSLMCMATCGHFIELGKQDFVSNSSIGMTLLSKNITFHAVSVDYFITHRPDLMNEICQRVIDGIDANEVIPLPHEIFSISNLETAMKYMTTGNHIGKILVDMEPIHDVPPCVPSCFSPDNNRPYLVTGGLGGVGLQIVLWLARKGVSRIIVSSRQGVQNGYQKLQLQWARSYGCDIIVFVGDLSDEHVCEKCFLEYGSFEGIFHMAMVLSDAPFIEMSDGDWNRVCKPKHVMLENIHKYEKNCTHLIVFSSIACSFGNSNQSNYSYTNSKMEELCRQRNKAGQPGIVIQWGIIDNAGYTFDRNIGALRDNIFRPQHIYNCIDNLDYLMGIRYKGIITSFSTKKVSGKLSGLNDKSLTHLQVISRVLNQPIQDLSETDTLVNLGIDSIQYLEIQTIFEHQLNFYTTVAELSNYSIRDIKGLTCDNGIVQTTDCNESDILVSIHVGYEFVYETYIDTIETLSALHENKVSTETSVYIRTWDIENSVILPETGECVDYYKFMVGRDFEVPTSRQTDIGGGITCVEKLQDPRKELKESIVLAQHLTSMNMNELENWIQTVGSQYSIQSKMISSLMPSYMYKESSHCIIPTVYRNLEEIYFLTHSEFQLFLRDRTTNKVLKCNFSLHRGDNFIGFRAIELFMHKEPVYADKVLKEFDFEKTIDWLRIAKQLQHDIPKEHIEKLDCSIISSLLEYTVDGENTVHLLYETNELLKKYLYGINPIIYSNIEKLVFSNPLSENYRDNILRNLSIPINEIFIEQVKISYEALQSIQ
jgi:NADPH:quinone reductase-like Zn-dependent oxidoreductase